MTVIKQLSYLLLLWSGIVSAVPLVQTEGCFRSNKQIDSLDAMWISAEFGESEAVSRFANFLINDLGPQRYAVVWAAHAADLGDAKLTSYVGDRFYYGEGVRKDLGVARRAYFKAAQQDEPWGKMMSGAFLCNDKSAKVKAEGFRFMEEAAQMQNPVAEINFGWALMSGDCGRKDVKLGGAWLLEGLRQRSVTNVLDTFDRIAAETDHLETSLPYLTRAAQEVLSRKAMHGMPNGVKAAFEELIGASYARDWQGVLSTNTFLGWWYLTLAKWHRSSSSSIAAGQNSLEHFRSQAQAALLQSLGLGLIFLFLFLPSILLILAVQAARLLRKPDWISSHLDPIGRQHLLFKRRILLFLPHLAFVLVKECVVKPLKNKLLKEVSHSRGYGALKSLTQAKEFVPASRPDTTSPIQLGQHRSLRLVKTAQRNQSGGTDTAA